MQMRGLFLPLIVVIASALLTGPPDASALQLSPGKDGLRASGQWLRQSLTFGLSGGGSMAQRLVVEISPRIAGVAAVMGHLWSENRAPAAARSAPSAHSALRNRS